MVVKVFDTLRGPISGPNIKWFQRFGEYWGSIDRSEYESVLKVGSIASALNPVWDDLIQFIQCSGTYRVSASATVDSISRSRVRVRQCQCSHLVTLTLPWPN